MDLPHGANGAERLVTVVPGFVRRVSAASTTASHEVLDNPWHEMLCCAGMNPLRALLDELNSRR